jgi:hypothetical protein
MLCAQHGATREFGKVLVADHTPKVKACALHGTQPPGAPPQQCCHRAPGGAPCAPVLPGCCRLWQLCTCSACIMLPSSQVLLQCNSARLQCSTPCLIVQDEYRLL